MTPAPFLTATLPSLIAAVPDSAAGQAGYVVGLIIGVLLMLGITGFGILAVVLAFVRRTTGWIITGSFAGFFAVAFLIMLGVGFVKGFSKGVQSGLHSKKVSGEPQSVTGKTLAYTVQVAPGWTIKRQQGDYDLLANSGGVFFSVVAEDANLGSPKRLADAARTRINTTGDDIHMSDPEPVTIDGREWLAFTVKCKVKLIPFAYQFYCYSGKEGSYQLIGWTFQNLWDSESPKLRESMQTFHFPAATPDIESK